MLPLVVKDLVKQAGELVSDLATQLLDGTFDTAKEASKTKYSMPIGHWDNRSLVL